MFTLQLRSLTLFLVVFIGSGISFAQSGQPPESTVDETRKAAEARRDALEAWRCSLPFGKTWLNDRPTDAYVEWEFLRLPDTLKESIYPFSEWIFRVGVSPHKSRYPIEIRENADLQFLVIAAGADNQSDLARYCWNYNGRRLCVVTSLNALRVDFELKYVPQCQWTRAAACVDGARKWVEEVLRLEGEYSVLDDNISYRVELPWPSQLVDGLSFSSAPEQNIMRLPGMPRWYERVDAFVENGVLSILIYKKIGQLMGYQDGSKWFPDDFRALVHQKALEQGRLRLPDENKDPKMPKQPSP